MTEQGKRRYKLQDGYRLKMEIQGIKDSIEELRINMTSLQSIRAQERTQGGDTAPDKAMIDKLNRLSELEKKLEELVELQLQMTEDIDLIPDRLDRVVLRYRYINNFTWERIAERMNYSERHLKRLHIQAVKNFEKIFLKCH